MANSILTRGSVALMGCLLLTAAQAQEPAQPKNTTAVTQDGQLCRSVARPGSRIATRQCGTALDGQRADQARVTRAYPHEGIYGYTSPPSIVMNR